MQKKTNNILCAEHLVKTFGSGHTEVRAVDDVSLTVARGELVAIMGPSGSGKTTLVSMLGALLTPNSGAITIDEEEITSLGQTGLANLRARKIGFIFQSFNLLEALSLEENILFPAHRSQGGVTAAKPRVEALMERLNLTERRRALPKTLSGGEMQRTAIARALINQPRIVFADEPTGNLDSYNGQEVLMILHDIARDQDCAIVLVSHDPQIEEVADRLLWLEDGEIRNRKTERHSWVRDPVCGMRVDAWTATLVADHAGKRYVFCSERCVERFKAEPVRYISLTEPTNTQS